MASEAVLLAEIPDVLSKPVVRAEATKIRVDSVRFGERQIPKR